MTDGGYGRDVVQKVRRTGWTPGGVPVYDTAHPQVFLDRTEPPGGGGPGKLFLVDADTVIFGSCPITAVKPDGTVVWTYPDPWPDVHGSHRAPIPQSDAVLVGVLSCIGTAAGTPVGNLWAMNSNMGRLYVMTTDGLLVASVFQDTRAGADPWPSEAKPGVPMGGVSMGGEWFGGYFFKADATDEYYVIAGGTSYNLIRLDGFNTLRPIEGGAVTFSREDLAAAEELLQRRAAEKAAKQTLTITRLAAAPAVDGKLDEFPSESFVEWNEAGYRARAALAVDGANLCLAYHVWGDRNPMVNGGQDFTHLFVTGDSVDLQLGTKPDADPKRRNPVAGDLRLLISVLGGKPVAVLYRWKTDGEKRPQTFRSPWRQITLDYVRLLDDATVSIVRRGSEYTVEATVPLATLGFKPQPGKQYRADLGVIYSDAKGNNRAARVYWSNKATGLTADIPGEIMATPNLWGTATLAP